MDQKIATVMKLFNFIRGFKFSTSVFHKRHQSLKIRLCKYFVSFFLSDSFFIGHSNHKKLITGTLKNTFNAKPSLKDLVRKKQTSLKEFSL